MKKKQSNYHEGTKISKTRKLKGFFRVFVFSWFIIMVLFFIPAFLNIPLKNYFHPPAESAEQDLIYRMFGGLRGLLADWAFMKGEEYYHGGLPIRSTDTPQCMQEEMNKVRGESTEEHEHKHEHADEQAGKTDLYSNLYSNIKVTRHSHLSYAAEKEVLPWFYLQVRFNPHDIQGYTLGGYWLRRVGRPDEALRFLKEGGAHNPESAQILMAIGELYNRAEDYGEAVGYLERARQLWLEGKLPNVAIDNYTISDRGYTFVLLGNLYEKTGKPVMATRVYRELYSFDPTRTILLEKIRKLKGM